MKNEKLTEFGLLIESHLNLDRQGPGSEEMTLKALSFIDNLDENSKIVDIGCGSGTQSLIIANATKTKVLGIDMIPEFIDVLNQRKDNDGKVEGLVGDALDLKLEKESLDLIWSEGMIDSIGFEKALTYWNDFLKQGGYVAVTSPSWITSHHPEEIDKFWKDSGSALYSVEDNIESMEKAGFSFVAAFTIPESCWTDNYYGPREKAEKELLEKYPENEMVKGYVDAMHYEVELYKKHKKDYGYVFYIGKKN